MRLQTRWAGSKSVIWLAIAGLVVGWCAVVLIRWGLNSASVSADRNCVQQAAEFTEYPLLFAGESYHGMSINACHRRQTPEKYKPDGSVYTPATDFYVFTYGDCEPAPGETSCAHPVQIFVHPACAPELHEGVKKEQATVRDVDVVVKIDGSVRIEADSYKATVYHLSGDYENSKRAGLELAGSLRGANAAAADITLVSSLQLPMSAPVVC